MTMRFAIVMAWHFLLQCECCEVLRLQKFVIIILMIIIYIILICVIVVMMKNYVSNSSIPLS